jgi:hypothetical protein
MRIIDRKRIEDCFDGSRVMRYFFDEAWARDEILRLASLGELEYFEDFPRPLFRVSTPGGAEIKGVEGEADCQVVYPKAGREQIQARLEAFWSWHEAP